MTKNGTIEVSASQAPLLTGWDKALFISGVVCLVLGLLALVAMLSLVYGDFYGDFLTFNGALGAVGASLGAIATTFAAIGSALLFVVSLRVQARELRHSIEELKSSVEAQKDAANSHKSALTLAKQEKEFNVCLSAIESTIAEVQNFNYSGSRGARGIDAALGAWYHSISDVGLESAIMAEWTPFRSLINPDDVFNSYDNLDALNIRMYWVLNSLREKELAADDKRYLYSLIDPVIKQVGKAQVRLGSILERFDELSRETDEILHRKGIVREVWKCYRGHIQALYDRRQVLQSQPIAEAPH
jgi:uncharacterized membrane protein